MDLVGHDDESAPVSGMRAGSDPGGGEKVGRPVGAGEGGVAHGTGDDDGLRSGVQEMQVVGGFFEVSVPWVMMMPEVPAAAAWWTLRARSARSANVREAPGRLRKLTMSTAMPPRACALRTSGGQLKRGEIGVEVPRRADWHPRLYSAFKGPEVRQ